MVASTTDSSERRTPWMALSQASRMLGVSQAALRQWADQGQIRSFRTPGGHRRFAQDDLTNLVQTRQLPHSPQGSDQFREKALVGIRRRMQTRRSEYGSWYDMLDDDGRERMRLFGRQLMALVTDTMARPRSRNARLNEARSIGTAYGREGTTQGWPLSVLLHAFVFFRASLDETARALVRREGMTPNQVIDLWQQMDGILDAVLIASIAVYEAATAAVAPAPPSAVT